MKFTRAQIYFLKELSYFSDDSEAECPRREINIAKALKAKGYIKYEEPEKDDKYFMVSLTEKGLFLFEGCLLKEYSKNSKITTCGFIFQKDFKYHYCPYCGKGLTDEKLKH